MLKVSDIQTTHMFNVAPSQTRWGCAAKRILAHATKMQYRAMHTLVQIRTSKEKGAPRAHERKHAPQK